jgi:CHAD domain-containing protein
LLAKASDREIGEAVHEARKSLKRLRALVKISRPALGDARYRRENAEFRQTGRLLSAARDAKVLIETLDGLLERARDELSPDTAVRCVLDSKKSTLEHSRRSFRMRPLSSRCWRDCSRLAVGRHAGRSRSRSSTR